MRYKAAPAPAGLAFFCPNITDPRPGQRPPDNLLIRWNPAAVHVLNSGEYASHLATILPKTAVFFRHWSPIPGQGDDNLSNMAQHPSYQGPIERANYLMALCPDRRVWKVIQNETTATADHRTYEIEAARHLLDNGHPVALGSFGPGHPHITATDPVDGLNRVAWTGPELAPLAQLATDYPDRVWLNLHEYIYHHDHNYGYWSAGDLAWYVGRFRQCTHYWPNVRILVGEHGFDDNEPQFKGWRHAMQPEQFIAGLLQSFEFHYREAFEAGQLRAACIYHWKPIPSPDFEYEWRFDISVIDPDLLIHLADSVRTRYTNMYPYIAIPTGENSVRLRAAPSKARQ